MTQHTNAIGSSVSRHTPSITLRSSAELADALPYLLGFYPNDSVVLAALHGERGRFGGRLRLGIPTDPEEWPEAATELAGCLVRSGEQRGERPDAVVLFLCQDPAEGESPVRTMERLRPLAQGLRLACGARDVPVVEALCLSAGRWFSYCCPETACCPAEGNEIKAGESVMAATAAYAGIRVRGSLREMEARLDPPALPDSSAWQRAMDDACAELVPQILDTDGSVQVRRRTLSLIEKALDRFRAASPREDGPQGDRADDALLADDEAALILVGLQDRTTRDRAAEWNEPPHSDAALRLWRALARRCVRPYQDYAAAPVTLAGWVAWSSGDEATARMAFGRALSLDPDYTFARLLSAALADGLDAEPIRHCLRRERDRRTGAEVTTRSGPTGPAGRGPGRQPSGNRRARTGR
jgi:hypothetical protein